MGRLRAKDLSGQTFYPWEVLSVGLKDLYNQSRWNVRCVNCGFERLHPAANIKAGYGCRNCSLLPKGRSGLNKLLSQYKSQAKRNNRVFAISFEEFEKLTGNVCHYCGLPPSSLMQCGNYRRKKSSWGDYYYNGLDRVDNNKDYAIVNCVSCCWRCNRTFGPLFSYKEKLILAESLRRIDELRKG